MWPRGGVGSLQMGRLWAAQHLRSILAGDSSIDMYIHIYVIIGRKLAAGYAAVYWGMEICGLTDQSDQSA